MRILVDGRWTPGFPRYARSPRSALIVDQCRYQAEGPERVLRRARTRGADSSDRMYGAIARALVEGTGGDTLDWLQLSGMAALDAQDLVDASMARRGGAP